MFAALCLAAGLVPAADPAPLPDRWLLKLLPADLPDLPDRLYNEPWHADHVTRGARLSWAVWVEFRRAVRGRPAVAVVTAFGEHGIAPAPPGRRAVPLAVHGPLVEFDGRLYTATLSKGKPDPDPEQARDALHLGSAVEVRNRAWYQAGTTTPKGGKAVVEEWWLEFKDDLRTAAEGTVAVRGHWRKVTEPEGEPFSADLRFKAEGSADRANRARARIVTLVLPEGKKLPHRLRGLVIGDESRGGADFIWVDGQDRLSLHPADARQPAELVQPPAKTPKE